MEQKNISELQASLTNQTRSILPHHWSCPPAYWVQLVPSLIWRLSVTLLPIHFVFPFGYAEQQFACRPLDAKRNILWSGNQVLILKTHFQSSFQLRSTSNIIWHSTKMMMFSLETGGEMTMEAATRADDEPPFNSLWGLCWGSLQWSSTLTPTPALATVRPTILEGFYEWWVW